MSKRLQVLLDDRDYRDLQKLARRNRMTVSEWVRHALRAMRRREPIEDAGRKLAAVRSAARHTFPAADMEQMLVEIERGYLGDGEA
ncbi:MAG: antitoxin [Gemmatimonadaceae bacterium]